MVVQIELHGALEHVPLLRAWAFGFCNWPLADVFTAVWMPHRHLLDKLDLDLLHTDGRCVVIDEALDDRTLAQCENISWNGHCEVGSASAQASEPSQRFGHCAFNGMDFSRLMGVGTDDEVAAGFKIRDKPALNLDRRFDSVLYRGMKCRYVSIQRLHVQHSR